MSKNHVGQERTEWCHLCKKPTDQFVYHNNMWRCVICGTDIEEAND